MKKLTTVYFPNNGAPEQPDGPSALEVEVLSLVRSGDLHALRKLLSRHREERLRMSGGVGKGELDLHSGDSSGQTALMVAAGLGEPRPLRHRLTLSLPLVCLSASKPTEFDASGRCLRVSADPSVVPEKWAVELCSTLLEFASDPIITAVDNLCCTALHWSAPQAMSQSSFCSSTTDAVVRCLWHPPGQQGGTTRQRRGGASAGVPQSLGERAEPGRGHAAALGLQGGQDRRHQGGWAPRKHTKIRPDGRELTRVCTSSGAAASDADRGLRHHAHPQPQEPERAGRGGCGLRPGQGRAAERGGEAGTRPAQRRGAHPHRQTCRQTCTTAAEAHSSRSLFTHPGDGVQVRRTIFELEPRLRTVIAYHPECLDHQPARYVLAWSPCMPLLQKTHQLLPPKPSAHPLTIPYVSERVLSRGSELESPDRVEAVMSGLQHQSDSDASPPFPPYMVEVTSGFDRATVEAVRTCSTPLASPSLAQWLTSV